METIARIPELPSASEPTAVRPNPPVGGRRRPRFPFRSVAALAAIAAGAWLLANWHEQERLARQRRPDRLASRPPATAGEAIAP